MGMSLHCHTGTPSHVHAVTQTQPPVGIPSLSALNAACTLHPPSKGARVQERANTQSLSERSFIHRFAELFYKFLLWMHCPLSNLLAGGYIPQCAQWTIDMSKACILPGPSKEMYNRGTTHDRHSALERPDALAEFLSQHELVQLAGGAGGAACEAALQACVSPLRLPPPSLNRSSVTFCTMVPPGLPDSAILWHSLALSGLRVHSSKAKDKRSWLKN